MRQIRAGAAGERDAAYEIEFHSADNVNRVTIHDLRLEVGGRVAQIDHLLINRLLDTWVLESKHFAEGVSINDLLLSGPASPVGAQVPSRDEIVVVRRPARVEVVVRVSDHVE